MRLSAKIAIKYLLLSFVALSTGYMGWQLYQEQMPSIKQSKPVINDEQQINHKIVAYYFHGTSRCSSCLTIESYTNETIKNKFSNYLDNKTLEWKVINVEEPVYNHFVTDYQLHTKSVVLVELKDGNQIKWKNLDKVWEHLKDKNTFQSYVESELNQFLAGV